MYRDDEIRELSKKRRFKQYDYEDLRYAYILYIMCLNLDEQWASIQGVSKGDKGSKLATPCFFHSTVFPHVMNVVQFLLEHKVGPHDTLIYLTQLSLNHTITGFNTYHRITPSYLDDDKVLTNTLYALLATSNDLVMTYQVVSLPDIGGMSLLNGWYHKVAPSYGLVKQIVEQDLYDNYTSEDSYSFTTCLASFLDAPNDMRLSLNAYLVLLYADKLSGVPNSPTLKRLLGRTIMVTQDMEPEVDEYIDYIAKQQGLYIDPEALDYLADHNITIEYPTKLRTEE